MAIHRSKARFRPRADLICWAAALLGLALCCYLEKLKSDWLYSDQIRWGAARQAYADLNGAKTVEEFAASLIQYESLYVKSYEVSPHFPWTEIDDELRWVSIRLKYIQAVDEPYIQTWALAYLHTKYGSMPKPVPLATVQYQSSIYSAGLTLLAGVDALAFLTALALSATRLTKRLWQRRKQVGYYNPRLGA